MNNYRANQHRLGRNDRGRVTITRESLLAKRVANNLPLSVRLVQRVDDEHPGAQQAPTAQRARDILTEIVNESGCTICPKIGAHQWMCTREECTCHRKEYAHTYACAVAINYPCFCGAKT